MRQIVLDTETTGLEPSEGHRIIEIGCVEMVNRRLTGNDFHQYLNPGREVEQVRTVIGTQGKRARTCADRAPLVSRLLRATVSV